MTIEMTKEKYGHPQINWNKGMIRCTMNNSCTECKNNEIGSI